MMNTVKSKIIQATKLTCYSILLLVVATHVEAELGFSACGDEIKIYLGRIFTRPGYYVPGATTAFPLHKSAAAIGSNTLIFLCEGYTIPGESTWYSAFAIAFNATKHIPDWVMYQLAPGRLKTYPLTDIKELTREGSGFSMNQELLSIGMPQAIPLTYNINNAPTGTGKRYAKGHLVPNNDALYQPEAQALTFTFANAVPQYDKFNGGVWSRLEGAVRDYVEETGHTIFVITGVYGTSYQNTTSNKFDYIGPPGSYFAHIPACFYKVFYDSNTGESWAFLMPNTNTTVRESPWYNRSWNDYFITVNDLQRRMSLALYDPDQKQAYSMVFFNYNSQINQNWPKEIPEIWRNKYPPSRPVWYNTNGNPHDRSRWRMVDYPKGRIPTNTFPGC